MKKILLTLVIFAGVCAAPSSALKQIINNEKDRIVPSRLMGSYYNPSDGMDYDRKNPNGGKYVRTSEYVQNGVYVIPGWRAEEYNRLYKPLLGRNIRPELAGTAWEYPDYEAVKTKYEQEYAVHESADKNSNPSADKKYAKKHEREAADYYYRDTLSDPDKIMQSGYDLINVEE